MSLPLILSNFERNLKGFMAADGFKNVYRGMSSVAVESAPGAALFFSTYTATKNLIDDQCKLYFFHSSQSFCELPVDGKVKDRCFWEALASFQANI